MHPTDRAILEHCVTDYQPIVPLKGRIPSGTLYRHVARLVKLGWLDKQGALYRATEAGRGTQVDVWAIEQSIERGYAVATIYYGEIVPDNPNVSGGIRPYFRKPGTNPGPHDWGAIAAWAWLVVMISPWKVGR